MRRFPGIVAALVPCLAACGEVEKFTDAGMLDANAVDADVTIDANPPGQVTVTTHSRCCEGPSGALIAGVEVFVIQPDGTLGDSGLTNAAGTITLDDVQAGAGITAVYAVDNPKNVYRNREVVTVLGVKPGDALVFGEHYTPNRNVSTGTVTVRWPSTPSTGYFVAATSCTSNVIYDTAATSTTLSLYEGCTAATADLVVYRVDNSQYRLAGSAVLRGAAFTAGADLGPVTFAAPNNLATTATGLPAYVTDARFEAGATLAGVQTWNDSQDQTPMSGAATGALIVAPGGDAIAGSLELDRQGEFGSQLNLQAFAASATTAPFTVVEIPWVGDQLVSASAQFATWVQLGEQPYDGAVATTSWNRYTPGPDGAEGYYTGYDWTLLLPPGITTYTWDDPPAEVAPHLPDLGDGPRISISLLELASASSYDELRGTAEWIFADPRGANYRGELTGRATTSDGGEGGGSGAAPPLRPLLDKIQVQGTR